jgi:hypothetical protein
MDRETISMDNILNQGQYSYEGEECKCAALLNITIDRQVFESP